MSPYMPPKGNPPLPSQFDNSDRSTWSTRLNNLLFLFLYRTNLNRLRPPLLRSAIYGKMWVGRFEPLGFNADRGVEGVGGTAGYEYAERMGMVV